MKSSLILLLLLPAPALAESSAAEISRHQTEEEFRALDLNRDGYVSAAEAAGFGEIVTRFDKADRNRDGKLSRAEFTRLKTLKVRVAKAKDGGKGAVGGTAARREKKSAAD